MIEMKWYVNSEQSMAVDDANVDHTKPRRFHKFDWNDQRFRNAYNQQVLNNVRIENFYLKDEHVLGVKVKNSGLVKTYFF